MVAERYPPKLAGFVIGIASIALIWWVTGDPDVNWIFRPILLTFLALLLVTALVLFARRRR